MECPKCGAENPAAAEHCNLCFHRFGDPLEPPASVEVAESNPGPPTTGISIDPDEPRRESDEPAPVTVAGPSWRVRILADDVLKVALKGGLVATAGVLLILADFAIMQALNVRVFDFFVRFTRLNPPKVSLFILLITMFGLLFGGVAGNLKGKRAIVPGVRLVAVAVGLSIWAGVIQALTVSGMNTTDWMSKTTLGILLTLFVFPLVATIIGLCESIGRDWSMAGAIAGAMGGLIAGFATAVIVSSVYLLVPIFGTDMPMGFFGVTVFALKLIVITGAYSFIAGVALWYAVSKAETILPI